MKHSSRIASVAVVGLALVAGWPAAATAQVTFTDVTASAGLTTPGDFRGGGWADYDEDGCVDVVVSGLNENRLYRSNCDGTFSEVSVAAGIDGPESAMGVAWADHDEDGDLDLYVGSWDFPNVLYENLGDGTFADVSVAAGVDDERATAGVSWVDYDADGDLDLWVANRFTNVNTADKQDRLYRNEGDGTFTDVAPGLGIEGAVNRNTFMGVWSDLDQNGTQDLYLSVDFGDDVLYRNDGGSFTDVSDAAGVADPQHGMGVAIGDLDGDLCLDVVVTNNTQGADPEFEATFVKQSDCAGAFVKNTAGILDREVVEWGINWVDFDNDGDEDLAIVAGGMLSDGEPNVLYRNDGGVLNDVTTETGTANAGAAFGSAWSDFDGDGDQDWLVVNEVGSNVLFRNDGEVGSHLRVLLEGVVSNRRGIGARVEVRAGGTIQAQVLFAGESYLSCHQAEAFFGLGAATADRLWVFWPSGVLDQLTVDAVDETLTVTEGEAIANGGRFRVRTAAPDGSPEPETRVALRFEETGEDEVLTSDATGNLTIPDLLPGTYHLRASKAGFQPSPLRTMELELSQSRNVLLRLREAAQ